MIQKTLGVIFFSLFSGLAVAAPRDSTTRIHYDSTLQELNMMLRGNAPLSFERAVYLVEDAYLGHQFSYNAFDSSIQKLSGLASRWMTFNHLDHYRYEDSLNVLKNLAIYKVLKDTVRLVADKYLTYIHLPYTYDFENFQSTADWRSMLVVKLLDTHSGNCHSLPFLYKILADALGATCWLSTAPNHIYIKNRCASIGWYNTELTSGCFPIDAWIMASGYLPLKAIQTGIYMDTLSNTETMTLCVVDLAKAYEHKTHNYSDGFILNCCDLALKYYPLNVQAILLKAETLKRIYEQKRDGQHIKDQAIYRQMEAIYGKLFDLGYREMPPKMYQDWMQSVTAEKEKYANKQVQGIIGKGGE